MYDPDKNVIYYPDIEGLPEEILPAQADLLGIDDLEEVARIQWEQAPMLLAHEMFHCWRASSGCLTQDYWHEEWAANALAVAYARQFDPAALSASVALAESVLSQEQGSVGSRYLDLLSSCHEPSPAGQAGYGLPLRSILIVTLEMIRKIDAEQPDLSHLVESLLARREGAYCVVAA
jgi:hypothetical protein